MQDLTFTLWMLLFPLAATANTYLYEVKLRRRPTDRARALSAALDLLTRLAVGYLLYGK
ncbi:MAG TPA: hypothetical protein VN282_13500 [Pyrinomonadaceae bacterium]|nr:hypothetical protein [Pyrinomonadaceae bacterium]